MSSVTTPEAGELSASERRAQARAAYRQSVRDGTPLSGKALAGIFGRSERWGRQIIAETRHHDDSNGNPATLDGNRQPDSVGTSGEVAGSGRPAATAREMVVAARPGSPALPANGNGAVPAGGTMARTGSDPAHHGPSDDGHQSAVPGTQVDSPLGTSSPPAGNTGTVGRNGSGRPDTSGGSPSPAEHLHGNEGGNPTDTGSTPATPPAVAAPGAGLPGWIDPVTRLSVALVAMAAAVWSVNHLADVSRLAGTSDWKVWLLPAAVDGLATTASLVLYRAHLLGRSAGPVAWVAFLAGVAASVAGNVVATYPELVTVGPLKVAVGATPPLSLALALHLLLHQPRR